jgi:hypothetical protein
MASSLGAVEEEREKLPQHAGVPCSSIGRALSAEEGLHMEEGQAPACGAAHVEGRWQEDWLAARPTRQPRAGCR